MVIEKETRNSALMLSRLAVSLVFYIAGTLTASWFAQIPQIQTKLGIDKAQIGLGIMFLSVGVLVGVTLTSGFIARFSSRHVSIGAGLLMAVSLVSLGILPNLLSLYFGLFFFGLFTSTMDVAMNAQAVEVERLWGKQIMNSFHAAWSIGNFTGAAIASTVLSLNWSIFQHYALVAPIAGVILLVAALSLLNIEGEKNPEATGTFQLPPRVLWPLGAVAFASAMSEGSMLDWSGIYLKEIVLTNDAQAAWGISAVSATMTLGRFFGDYLADRFGAANLVRGGAVLAVIGLSIALLFPSLWISLLGFALVGAGLSTSIPLAFSAAGKIKGLPSGRGVAGVATVGYSAFLIGPGFIGFVSEATNLQIAYIIILILLVSLIFTGRALRVDED